MEKILPTLSTSGFITDKNVLMNKLMVYYKTTVTTQTTVFDTNLISFLHTLEISEDESELRSKIVDDLTSLYNRYFEVTEVGVVIKENNNNTYDIEIDVSSKDTDGITYNIMNKISTDKVSMEKISNSLNKFKKDI